MVIKEPAKKKISIPAATEATTVPGGESAATSRWIEPADGWLAAGILSCGTMLLGPFGAIPLIIGLVKLWRSVHARYERKAVARDRHRYLLHDRRDD